MTFISDFLNPTILSSLAFLISVLLIVYFTVRSLKMGNKGLKFFLITAIVLIVWFFVVFSLGRIGFFAKNPLFAPNIVFGFLILFELLRRVYFSKTVQNIADNIPIHWIIGIQTYRIVGVGFLILWAEGLLPAAFAFSAGIGDVFVGITAPFVALFCYLRKSFSKRLAIAWNIIGIADLIIALSVGFVGFSRPVQFVPLSPSTEAISLFPLVIVPLFAVPLALLLHFFSLRALKK